jgi:hypothetical protein
MSLSEPPQRRIPVLPATLIRTDLNTPVFTFQTETDVVLLGSMAARQADSDSYRLWEVAGTAHADIYTVVLGSTDVGDSPDAAKVVEVSMPIAQISCPLPLNSGPHHFVLNAAVRALHAWVKDGIPPPTAPLLEVSGLTIQRDQYGNAIGGVRTPYVDVPIATLSGEGQSGSTLCILFGTTKLFGPEALASLYPTQEVYVSNYNVSADAAVDAGFILAEDARLMKTAAAMTDLQAIP